MPTVSFPRLHKKKTIVAGATILAAANRSGVPIGQSCGGEGACGWCRVRIVEGSANIEPPSAREQALMREKNFLPDERAACQARVRGDCSVDAGYW